MNYQKLESLSLKRWMKKTMKRLPNEVEASYIAGLIDGEGSFHIARQINKKTKNVRYQSTIVVVMNAAVLKDLWKVYGGCLFQYPSRGTPQPVNYCYYWSLMDSRILKPLLQEILPFLKVKRKQAELLLEALETTDKKKLSNLKRRISRLNNKYYGLDPLFISKQNEA